MKKTTAYIIIIILLILTILSEYFHVSRSFPFVTFELISSPAENSQQESIVSEKEASHKNLDKRTSVKVPIAMYHSLLKDPARRNRYCISPSLFEEDLKYLKSNGYETITMTQLINYVKYGTKLPKKPVILTFDDGYYNNYLYAFPLLKKYESKAVISIIGTYTDQYTLSNWDHPNYSHVTWYQIREMYASGYVEFQNHSYDSHQVTAFRNGSMQGKGESLKAYEKYLTEDLSRVQLGLESATGVKPNTFVYPFGAISPSSKPIIKKMGFEASLSCLEGMNAVSQGDKQGLYRLKHYLRPPDISSQQFFEKILQN